ncbi:MULTISPECIES: hypothetical protein [Micrococcaceae]|uniref:hypothetical protein n=1 Tax=Micrococcaceae TaxID=1268 RepID=UPI0016219500|nr:MULTISPECIES: hypothetical protein [Micrococcaceae]MBB5749320.1 hypothetical protein [Micrococcus sp. TA1]HRO30283.1 hypothetical protein [Citricoccus sp.]HRO93099.1 hypothetical protein [Citricoccus sp.]
MDHQHQPRDDDHRGRPGPYGPDQPSGWGAPAPGPGYDPYGRPQPPAHDPYGRPVDHSPYGYPQQSGYGVPSRRPGTIPLIPLALGDILGGAFSTIRRNAAAVLGTALIVALLEIILSALAAMSFLDAAFELVMLEESGQDPFAGDPLASPYLGQLLGSLGVLLLAALVTLFTGIIAQGVLSVVVLRAAAGLRTSLGQAWRLTGRQAWSLAGLGGLYLLAGAVTMVVFLGLLFVLVAGAAAGDTTTTAVMGILLVVLSLGLAVVWVWLYVKVLLAPAAVAVEQHAPFRAVGRSWSLTRGHWWRTFGIVLLVSVIVGVISSVITTPLSLIGGLGDPFLEPGSVQQALESARVWMLVTLVVTALVNAVTRAFLSCVTALLYVDYRIRHESFDLDLAAAADRAGAADDERFSTVRDVQAAAGTEDLVPGRHRPTGTPGPA